MTNCPTCQKPVDPIRSRFVSVRDGKVVAYCSAECLAAAATQPVRVPTEADAAPKPAPRLQSEPVIQILHEPASGVVTSAPDARKSAPMVAQPDPALAKPPDEKPKDKKTDKVEKADRKKEKRASEKRVAEKKSEPVLEASTVKFEAKPDAKPEAKLEAKPEAPDEKPAKQSALLVEDEAAAEPKVSPAALAEAAATAPPKKRNRRDSIDARSAFEWLDDEPAEVKPRRRGKRYTEEGEPIRSNRLQQGLIVAGIVGVCGAGGYFAYDRFMKAPAAPQQHVAVAADAGSQLVTNIVTVDPDAPIAVDDPAMIRERALKNALAVLQRNFESTSDQVKEKAAYALARAQDKAAIDWLAELMPRAGTDTKKLEIAYVLARAKDPRGLEALMAATKVVSRDTRVDAGKKLAQLGDKAAVPFLLNFIDLKPNRYEVAKALAPFGDKRALTVLQEMRYNGDDEKAKAALALVAAGKPELVGEVEAMLADETKPGWHHEASLALAEQGNAKARPFLLQKLHVQSTQTEIARALRRVDPAADLTPQLTELEKGLLSEKDLEQIKAADTILILAGPPAWTERP